jgi:SAM-dependent methyltransferase
VRRSIYQHPRLYRLAMRAGYGRDYRERYRRLADLITEPAHVLELCCGDLALHDHLERRGLLLSYIGFDGSPAMVAYGRRRGVRVERTNLRMLPVLPAADVVIMQASLYQFHGLAAPLLARSWAAAGRQLIITEPVRNLSSSTHPVVRSLGQFLSRTESGTHPFRFTEPALVELYHRCGIPITTTSRTRYGREVIVSSVREKR